MKFPFYFCGVRVYRKIRCYCQRERGLVFQFYFLIIYSLAYCCSHSNNRGSCFQGLNCSNVAFLCFRVLQLYNLRNIIFLIRGLGFSLYIVACFTGGYKCFCAIWNLNAFRESIWPVGLLWNCRYRSVIFIISITVFHCETIIQSQPFTKTVVTNQVTIQIECFQCPWRIAVICLLQIHVFENIHGRAAFSPENTLQRPCTVVNIYAGSTLGFLCQNRWERIVLTLQVGAVAWEGVFTVYILIVFFGSDLSKCTSNSIFVLWINWLIQKFNKTSSYSYCIFTCFASNCGIHIFLSGHFSPAKGDCRVVNIIPVLTSHILMTYYGNVILIIITISYLYSYMIITFSPVFIFFIMCFSVTSNWFNGCNSLCLINWHLNICITILDNRCRGLTLLSISSCIIAGSFYTKNRIT